MLLGFLFFVTAALYASVGQAGASGYLALMGVAGFDPAVMKPTALALNIVVAAIASLQFRRARRFSWRTFYPFCLLSIPCSFVGGAMRLPSHIYYPFVGIALLIAAALLLQTAIRRNGRDVAPERHPPLIPAILAGAAIGLLSGSTGTGSGIFLAPILLLTGWVEARRAAAITAAYNLLNSIAALAGCYATLDRLPATLPWWLIAAGAGGFIGSTVGSRKLPDHALRMVLAAILFAAGARLVLMR